VVRDSLRIAETIREFIRHPLDVAAMARQVDASLHRQRAI
jgi:hypothetical protein